MVRKGSWDRKESHKLAWSALLNPKGGRLETRSFGGTIPVERVKIRLRAIPKRILARVVLGIDHGAIDAAVEIGQERGVGSLSGYSDGTELLRPEVDGAGMRAHEVEPGDLRFGIRTGLFAAEEADSHTG